jgi:hypothetical protein
VLTNASIKVVMAIVSVPADCATRVSGAGLLGDPHAGCVLARRLPSHRGPEDYSSSVCSAGW